MGAFGRLRRAFLRFNTMQIIIDLDAEPMPCPRPRIAPKPFPRAYMPTQYTNWKNAVAGLILDEAKQKNHPVFAGPLAVTLHVRATRPKTSKLQFPKPDADNYAKSILDACTTAGIWMDDSQIVNLEVFKRWHRGGEPRIRIIINEIEQ